MDIRRNDPFALLLSLDDRLHDKIERSSKDYIRIESCMDLVSVAEACSLKNLAAVMIDLQLPSRFVKDVISCWRREKKRARLVGLSGDDGAPDEHVARFKRERSAQIVDLKVSIHTLQEFVFAPLTRS